MDERHMQIGEVAERTGLSLRTIRYYEEVDVVPPSARTPGGFRLYTEADVDRLLVVKRMKPLDLSLSQVRELLEVLDALATPAAEPRQELLDRLALYRQMADNRAEKLRGQLHVVQDFAQDLRVHQQRHAARSSH